MAGEPGRTEADICADARKRLDAGSPAEAIALLTDALREAPASLVLMAALGEVLCRSGRFAEAVQHLEKVVAADPDNVAILFYFGVALHGLNVLKPAIIHLRRAIDLQPRLTEGYRALAMALWGAGAREHAIATLDEARNKNAATGQTEGLCFILRQSIADWSVFDQSIDWIRALIDRGVPDLDPAICYLIPGLSAADQRRVAEAYGQQIDHRIAAPLRDVKAGDRIRIGYLSADFGNHPVGRLIAGVLEHHDRTRFEVFAYSIRREASDPLSRRLRAAPEHFVDLHQFSDADAAARIQNDRIEILIDLGGYTEGARPRIVARRPAPVQVNYLGMSGTSGSPAYDYILTDEIMTAPAQQAHYSEAPAYLPEVCFNIDPAEPPPQRVSDRTRWSLPEGAFVFCVFNNTTKITPHVFKVWMDILRAVPHGVLWLRDQVPGSQARLRNEAARAGIPAERMVFTVAGDRAEYFDRLASADLFLDCFPYNGGSTIADVLWAGLPVLTCAGDTYVSNMAASMVTSLGLADLVVRDLASYRDLANRLANDPARMAELRAGLALKRASATLFDSGRFTVQLEAVLAEMSRRSRQGLSKSGPIR